MRSCKPSWCTGPQATLLSEKAVAYISYQEWTTSPAAIKVDLIPSWAKLHILGLSVIPGIKDWQVDFLSCRHLEPEEWTLCAYHFQALCHNLGTQDMELLQNQTGLVCHQVLGHGAFAVDTLLTPWYQFSLIYDFPPLQSLPHLRCRMVIEGTLVIHITWNWPKGPGT